MVQSQHVSAEKLRQFFCPRSIALIGATDNLTSGFSEIGEGGTRLEREILDFARKRGLTLLGSQLNALEINPLLVTGSQIEALDVLVNWRE